MAAKPRAALTGINRCSPAGSYCEKMNEVGPVQTALSLDPDLPTEAKVAFLSRPETYSPAPGTVIVRETHMSWVFLAGERVYKLKKPVCFPYLDFSTMDRREQACRAELHLNRRLAPDVYLDVPPLVWTGCGLAINARGTPIDWLVCMRRLDERHMLDRLISDHLLQPKDVDHLADVLARFYRTSPPVLCGPDVYISGLRRTMAYNKRVLLDPRFNLPSGLVRRIDRCQHVFLNRYGSAIAARVRQRRIVEGHGDLRPEHICFDNRLRIIDCLEFNARLRFVDPFDEIAYLALECERLGAGWAGRALRRRMVHKLRDGPTDALFEFYTCYRAMLRTRLAIAHLYEEHPRTPEKWPRLAIDYLQLALRSARRLERSFKTRLNR